VDAQLTIQFTAQRRHRPTVQVKRQDQEKGLFQNQDVLINQGRRNSADMKEKKKVHNKIRG